MGNLETDLSRALPMNETDDIGRMIGTRQKGQSPKTTGERSAARSPHLIVLRDGRADHMGKGVTVLCNRKRKPAWDM